MSRASALARGRAMAEASMVDTCLIERLTGTVTDPVTGIPTETWVQVYSGPCRVQEHGGYPRDIAVAPDQPQVAVSRELQLPVSTSTGVQVGDRATMLTSVNDAGLVGRKMWLRGLPSKSEATARRFTVEQITG